MAKYLQIQVAFQVGILALVFNYKATAQQFLEKNITPDVQLPIVTLENVVISSKFSERRTACSIGCGGVKWEISDSIWNKTQATNIAPEPTMTVELYPNPVKRNGVLTIRWNKPVTNDQEIILYNAAAVKMFQKDIRTNKALFQEQLKLDLHAAGYYIIHVLDAKTNDKQVISFIVE